MPTLRNIIIFLVIAAVILSLYFFFFRGAPEGGEAALVTTPGALPDINAGSTAPAPGTDNPVITENFLTLLLSVKNIRLEDAVLSNPAFISLKDSSIELTHDGTEGRQNPFAQLGSDLSSSEPVPLIPAPPSSIPPEAPNL